MLRKVLTIDLVGRLGVFLEVLRRGLEIWDGTFRHEGARNLGPLLVRL